MRYTTSVSGSTTWSVEEGCLSERGEFGSVNRTASDTSRLLQLLKDCEEEIREAAQKEEQQVIARTHYPLT